MLRAFLVGDAQLIANLRQIHPEIMERLKVSINRLALQLLSNVVANKLSGQVLGKYTRWKATNRLRNSINLGTLLSGDTMVSQSVGTNLKYARIHEYGGVINHPGGTAFFPTRTGQIRFVSNANAKPNMPRTKPHTITMPERSFLRSTLREMREEISDSLARDVAEVVKKSLK